MDMINLNQLKIVLRFPEDTVQMLLIQTSGDLMQFSVVFIKV